MTFFFDNNFSPNIVAILRHLGVDAEALRDSFPPDIKDVDLFPRLRGSGMIFVTADANIRKRTVEAHALKECGVSAVFLPRTFPRAGRWDQVIWLTKHWRSIETHMQRYDPPVYLDVESNGKISRIHL